MADFYLRIDVRGRYDNQRIVNTFFYREIGYNALFVPDQLAAIGFTERFGTIYGQISVSSCEYQEIRVRRFDSFGLRATSSVWAFQHISGRIVAGVPSFVSAVMKRQKRNAGTRKHRGKLCIAAIAQEDVVGNTILEASDTWNKMGLLAIAMRGAIRQVAANGVDNYIAVPVLGNFRKRLANGEEFDVAPVGEVVPRSFLGTQRHRAPRQGRAADA